LINLVGLVNHAENFPF